MSKVFGIVVSELDIAGNIVSVGTTYDKREDAIKAMVELIEHEHDYTLSKDDLVCIQDFSQYIMPNDEYAYTIVDFN